MALVSERIETDVLVAGGGPAGAAAALTCRAAGLSVTLADQPKFLGQENGVWETLHPDALELLNLLGAHEIVPNASVGRLDSFRAGGQRRRLAPGPRPGWHVDRARFDALLLARAVAGGVKVLPSGLTGACSSGGGIEAGLAGGETVQARWMIDATGRRRMGSRLTAGRYRRLSPALISRTALQARKPARGGATEFTAYPWGWTWVTGTHGGCRTWTAVHAARTDLPDQVRQLLDGSVAGSLRTASATWFRTEMDSRARVLAAGDAAGSIDPASGLGMTNALASGLAAAKTVAMCLAQGTAAEQYVDRYHEWWAARLHGQASLLRSLYEESEIGLT